MPSVLVFSSTPDSRKKKTVPSPKMSAFCAPHFVKTRRLEAKIPARPEARALPSKRSTLAPVHWATISPPSSPRRNMKKAGDTWRIRETHRFGKLANWRELQRERKKRKLVQASERANEPASQRSSQTDRQTGKQADKRTDGQAAKRTEQNRKVAKSERIWSWPILLCSAHFHLSVPSACLARALACLVCLSKKKEHGNLREDWRKKKRMGEKLD